MGRKVVADGRGLGRDPWEGVDGLSREAYFVSWLGRKGR